MHIAYIFNSSLPSYNPGSLQVIKTCEGIIKNGHKVTGYSKYWINYL